ncbi:MAG: cyanophycin synthetase [Gemmatimonadetes bacterium]|nr:cyanophycin synthetase [Gemmatimonadota bacterium]
MASEEGSPGAGTLPAERLGDELRLRGVRALRGAGLWSRTPAVVAEVEQGRLEGMSTADVGGFAARLLAALPTLNTAECADCDGVALAPALELGISWAHLLQHVTVELQALAGSPVPNARVVPNGGEEGDLLVIGHEEEDLGIESVYEALDIVRRCLDGIDPEAESVVADLRDRFRRARPGSTARLLIQAARDRGIPVRRIPDDPVVQLGIGRNMRWLDASMTDFTSVIATDLTSDKHRTKRVLERVGLPVPKGEVVRSLDDALDVAEDLGFPVLLKPLDGNEGRGISGRVDTEAELRNAWPLADAEGTAVVVERFSAGRDHRVVVVGGRVVAVAERIPAHVVGDGARSIRSLAEETNREPRRDPYNPAATRTPLPLDAETERFLARRGFTLDSVPPAGAWVQLRATANISTGGSAIDRTDEIHPRNVVLCELATGATGLDVAGLDVLTPDISVPFDENGAVIIEVNAAPGLRMHTDPDVGPSRDVAGAILDMLYPAGSPATIPVIAITGTNGKTTTTRLTAHLFRNAGQTVGFTTTDGVYLQETLLMEGDLTGPFAASIILSHREVEVAVLETARGGILRSGLGFESCDVGVVLNVTADHLGLRGIDTVEQLADVKAVVAAAVKPGGHTVLNADDPLSYAMRTRTSGGVVLISRDGQRNPVIGEHLASGGTAAVVDREDGREAFMLRNGGDRVWIADVADVPLTVGGAARFQLHNVLAALAAANACGLTPPQIRAGLLSFFPSGASTPGRMNVLRTRRGLVVIDYAHNPAAVRGILDFAGRLEAGRRIGVITMPGDRRDEDLRELGEAAASFDYVIIKEHELYRRGRAPGDVARLIAEGLTAGGLAPDRQEVVLSEPEAVQRALDVMRQGDLVVVLADDSAAVLDQVQPLVVA